MTNKNHEDTSILKFIEDLLKRNRKTLPLKSCHKFKRFIVHFNIECKDIDFDQIFLISHVKD